MPKKKSNKAIEPRNKPFDIYKHLRRLSLAAFICTTLLMLIIFIESIMPGDISAAQSAAISESIVRRFEIADSSVVIPEYISLSLPIDTPEFLYIGDTLKLTAEYLPENSTVRGVAFSCSDYDIASIEPDGTLTFLDAGTVIITATSSANPDASTELYLNCSGINPQSLTAFELILPESIAIGEVAAITIVSESEALNTSGFEIALEGDSAALSVRSDMLFALSEGTVTVTASLNGIERSRSVAIINNPDYIRPEDFLPEQSAVTLRAGESAFLEYSALPQGSPAYAHMSSDDESIARIYDGVLTAYSEGSCTIELRSVFNPQCVAIIEVEVLAELPIGLVIIGDERALLNYATAYSVAFVNNPGDRSVTWSIDCDKGAINEEGYLFSKRLGKVTLRATSNMDPSIYAEKTVTITLFKSFHLYVRKILGHFSLFALLGFGIFFTLILLVRQKWVGVVFTPITGFVAAGLSEMFQLPFFTSGRYADWSDVFIDTLGALSGFIVALLVMGIIRIIWKKSNGQSYDNFLAAYRKLTFKSAFKKPVIPNASNE